ncbi:Uncharacterised protein [uncultured archaeon]|nr:Uncharacterised protein [uncultured archaeon]
MQYNKLVRDKIPEIIGCSGQKCLYHTASDKEYWLKLKEKFSEEFKEFSEVENKEELADLLEIIYAICDYKKFDRNKLELLRREKFAKRGGFSKRIILEES